MDVASEQRLAEIAEHLDISPTDFQRAQRRFRAVSEWLSAGQYQSGSVPDVYLQGSFRLGTVIRPYVEDRDGDFDIDQVCELSMPSPNRLAEALKGDIGNRLREHRDYERMLDEEGRRCWTLIYASDENRPGFHIDILPALPADSGEQFQIDITDKDGTRYEWAKSNPKGYYYWFKGKNLLSSELVANQKRRIFSQNRTVYDSIDDVPKQLIRSPLQRGIQLMKRHRDVYFAGRDKKPISIIITTIAAHQYDGGSISSALKRFVAYVKQRHETILRDGEALYDGVLDFVGGAWSVPNPTHQHRPAVDIENFADKWNKDHACAINFFDWVYQLDRDIHRYERSGISDELELRTKRFGTGESYSVRRFADARASLGRSSNATSELLDLIHLGIEGKIDWDSVQEVAQSIYDSAEGESKDVAKVNFYQIARHRGIALSPEAIRDVRSVLANHSNSEAFKTCCNLLLGTVTREMISACIRERGYDDVLSWPIMRLADRILFLPC